MTPNGFIANISCRDACDGLGVADSVWYQDNPDALRGLPEFVLLVHGYNDHRSYADCAYSYFLSQCLSLSNNRFSLPVAKLQWPGDQANPLAGAVEYHSSLQRAITSSKILADFLEDLASTQAASPGGSLRIHLIAHSLGNRLVLETMAILLAKNVPIHFSSLSMLAAAVRVSEMESKTDLRAAALAPDSTAVLHSTGDKVLEWAFPAGQTISGDGFWPEALGRYGHPQQWGHSQAFNWFGHSDYWFSAYSVAYTLSNLNTPADRQIIPNGVADNTLPPPNTTPSYTTPERETPSQESKNQPPKFKNPCSS
jgi:hypothetical protein